MTEPSLASLREQGAHEWNPVRFRYMEVMAQRLVSQSEPVQRVLKARLSQAVQAYVEGWQQQDQVSQEVASSMRTTPLPLQGLNQYLREHARLELSTQQVEEGARASDMKSVHRFRTVWKKVAAEQHVAKAAERVPENAGPLNAHRLMLRSMTLMRTLSPDYLSHFMAQMDVLLTLDQLNQQTALKDGKAKRSSRAKK